MTDPKTQSRLQRWSGKTMDESVTDPVRYAEEENRVPRTVRRWKDGQHPSWLTETVEHMTRVHESGGDVWRIASHVQSAAKWIVLRGKSTAELIERWHHLADLEHQKEMHQNRARQNGHEAHEEVGADESHACVLMELAAVRFELDVRGCDPRDYRHSTNGATR